MIEANGDTEMSELKTQNSTGMDRLRSLVQRAQQGDQAALPALRLMLDEHPEIWHESGDLARQAELAWIGMIAGQDLLMNEALERQLASMKTELAGGDASPLGRLLVTRVTACWLALHHAEGTYPKMHGATPAQHIAAQKRINAAQTRFLQAIKALATVRKLLQPARSPVEIASCLSGGEFRTASRGGVPAAVAVEN
jgi:hypothetical protein